jgi:hypothetical protein
MGRSNKKRNTPRIVKKKKPRSLGQDMKKVNPKQFSKDVRKHWDMDKTMG